MPSCLKIQVLNEAGQASENSQRINDCRCDHFLALNRSDQKTHFVGVLALGKRARKTEIAIAKVPAMYTLREIARVAVISTLRSPPACSKNDGSHHLHCSAYLQSNLLKMDPHNTGHLELPCRYHG